MICPHCKVSVPTGKWKPKQIVSDGRYDYFTEHFSCPECRQISIKFIATPKQQPIPFNGGMVGLRTIPSPKYYEEAIMPKTTSRDSIPKGVEDIFRIDYDRAVKQLPIDSMASAAYSRRLLQHYIEKKHKIKESDLKQEIKKLKEKNHYQPELVKLFDHIRHYGNFAAHATTNPISGEIIDVDPEEAEWLLVILEQIFVHDYELVQTIKEHEKKLQEKLRTVNPQKKKKSE
jgi:hypothetical protein